MPVINLHIPEADYELLERASGKSKRALREFILTAAEIRARKVLIERKQLETGKAPSNAQE